MNVVTTVATRDPYDLLQARIAAPKSAPATPDPTETIAFLESWFDDHDHSSGNISLTWQTESGVRTEHCPVSDRLQVAGLATKHATSGNVWINMATRRNGLTKRQRGGADDCVEVAGLWIDVDDANAPWHNKPGLPAGAEIVRFLRALNMPAPTMTLWTGGGVQVFWRFEFPLSVEEALPVLEAWQDYYTGFASALGFVVDETADVARMMRIPGTYNHKGAEPVPVEAIHINPMTIYPISEIENILGCAPTTSTAVAEGNDGDGDGDGDITLAALTPSQHTKTPDDEAIDALIDNLGIVYAYNRWNTKGATAPTTSKKEVTVRCPSPDHEDPNPSAHLNTAKNVFHCKSCGAKGDVLDLAAWHFRYPVPGYKDGATFPELRRKMAADLGHQPQQHSHTAVVTRPQPTSGSENGAWEPLMPLDGEPLPPFPLHCLPATFATFCEQLALSKRTPVDLPAVLVLGLLSGLPGGRAFIRVSPDWQEPAPLWTVAVAESGVGKSQILEPVVRPVRDLQDQITQSLQPEQARMQALKSAETQRVAHLQKKYATSTDATARSNFQKEIVDAQAAEEKILVPPTPAFLASGFTPEALVTEILAKQLYSGTTLVNDEGGWIDDTSRYASKGFDNVDAYLQAHSAMTIEVFRKGSQHVAIPKPALTVVSTIQPTVLKRLMEDTQKREKGFVARMCIVMIQSNVGYRTGRSTPVEPRVAAAYAKAITHAQKWWHDQGRVEISLTTEALDVHESWHDEVEVMMRPGSPLATDDGRRFGAKLAGTTIRIANALAIAASIDALPRVDAEVMRNAIEIARYFIAHYRRALGIAIEGIDNELASKVLRWVAENRFTQFNRAAASKHLHTTDGLDEALRLLVDRNYLRESRIPGKGRTATAYEVSPQIRND